MEFSQLQNVEKNINNVDSSCAPITSTPNVLVCSPIVCKEDVVNAYTPSHVLSATNDVISPRFEKHTIGIGPRLLSMMGYTRGVLCKN